MAKSRALGKGLSVLLGSSAEGRFQGEKLYNIPVEAIAPDPAQPRKHMDEGALASLAESIKVHGVLQPLLLKTAGEGFQIVAGERRWRAAVAAGLDQVPARVMDVSEGALREMGLIENIQREDLSPLEIAGALEVLIETFSLTQEEVAARIGWNRATVANRLRLLGLPDEIKAMLTAGSLSEGHARALLGLKTPEAMNDFAARAADGRMTVRQLEAAIKARCDGAKAPKEAAHRVVLGDRLQGLAKEHGFGLKIDRRAGAARVVLDKLEGLEDDRLLSAVENFLKTLFPDAL